METREERGVEIARSGKVRAGRENQWLVPSQSGCGTWVVDYGGGEPTCTCPDYEKRAAFCKHIFCVEIIRRRGITVTNNRKSYGQAWSNYNQAQVNEGDHFVYLLHDLCKGLEEEPQEGRGRRRTPLADVVFALVMKVYVGKSGRRAATWIKRCHKDGFLSKPVSYNTISDSFRRADLTPLLRDLVQQTALPLRGLEREFAIDSSGIGSRTYDRWFDEKWGQHKRRAKFRTAHIIVGTHTHCVTDVIVSDEGDTTQFQPLLERTVARFQVDEVSADKAYSSKKNHQVAADLGVTPFIKFKAGTRGDNGPDEWRKMYHYYQFKEADFLAHYHRRSNVETVFGMVKAKFGA
ncbi:MAG: transposase, partial [Myxococcales bacterium]|nr:transposase [Myxococcales bacterium]